MLTTIRALSALTLLAAAALPAAAQVGPFHNPANGHDYFIVSASSLSNYTAQAAALGAYPAVINNAEENEWVRANLNPRSPSGELLIGLTDAATEGDFVWVNADGALDSYTNWAPGEPNNSGGAENFTSLRPSGQWNDVAIPPARWALIEANPIGSQPTGIFAGPVCDPVTNIKYYLTTATTFDGAESFAQTLGGHLATIKDPRTNRFVMRNILTLPSAGTFITIGLTDRVAEGVFQWIDGSPSPFRFWASTEPNNFNNEDYVAIQANISDPNAGRWYDTTDTPRSALIEVNPVSTPPTFCPADFNHSGLVSVQDIFDFLAAYFAGCP